MLGAAVSGSGEPCLRTNPIHGFGLRRSKEASTRDPEQNPHMSPYAPLKAKGQQVSGQRSFAWRPWEVLIGCLDIKGGVCPLAQRSLSTCPWHSSNSLHNCNIAPVEHPAVQSTFATVLCSNRRWNVAKHHCGHGIGSRAPAWRRLRSPSPNCITAGGRRRSPSVSRYRASLYEPGTVIIKLAEVQ